MKIGLELNNNKAINEYKPIAETPKFSKAEKAGAARLDITGMYTDENAYKGRGKSSEELMQEAGVLDVATVRNYMTVMSNTMSGEDYQKAIEEGFDPSEMSGEESVTILDHIKAVMAESGQVVAGYNDDLDSDIFTEVTGKTIDTGAVKQLLREVDLPDTADNAKKILEAIDMMKDIDTLPEGSIKYMVDNELEPTIRNIYMSRFSAMDDGSRQARGYYAQDMGGYMARKADTVNWEEIKPQVEKALDTMNLIDITVDEALDDAKWLITKGLPLTEEKMNALEDVKNIEFPVKVEKILKASVSAIAEGKEPGDANLSIIKSRLTREVSRLKMSIDANFKLIKSGISIDTKPLEDVVEALKNKEEELKKQLFGGSDKIDLDTKAEILNKTVEVVREIPSMPAALIGRIAFADEEMTLNAVHTTGTILKDQFDKMMGTYEQVGTEVRRDLGDSITKAFRNVDDILKSLNLPTSKENERAVRILGYNSMLINEEEIKKVVEADYKLGQIIKGLTPGKALALIREGANPLDMKLEDLVRHIEELDHDPKRDGEKYSRFLYKLEKSGEITESEKESYLGIYRLLNRLEKTDHASIGRLLETGADITFGNLLTAMRSTGKSFNVSIDDDFGLLTETIARGTSITDQILSAFSSSLGNSEAGYDREYDESRMAEIKQTANADDAVYQELIDNEVNITPDNIMAQARFIEDPNRLFANIKAYGKRVDEKLERKEKLSDSIASSITKLHEALEDREEATSAYEEMLDTMTETLSEISDVVAQSTIDLKSINLMYKQLSLASSLVNEENYHVPVEINGRLTDVNLKLIHGSEAGLMSATLTTEEFGAVGMQVRLTGMSIAATFVAEGRDGLSNLQNIGDRVLGTLTEDGYELADVRYITGDPSKMGKISKLSDENADNNNVADTATLYRIAKRFITGVRTN